MWIVYVIISMIFYLVYSFFAKYNISKDEILGPYRYRFAICLLGMVALIIVMVFNLGESGLYPWQILIKYPVMLFGSVTLFFSEFLFLFAKRYVGISVEDTISCIYAPVLFLSAIAINLFSGKLGKISELTQPIKLVPILLIIIGISVLPNTEKFGKGKAKTITKEQVEKRKAMIIGIIILILAVFCDVTNSLCSMVVFDDNDLGYIDFLSSLFFACTIYGIILLVFTRVKKYETKKIFNKSFLYAVGISVLFMAYSFLEATALTLDSVSSNILWIAYPIVPIFLSRIVLKEKYSKKQYACIGIILLSSVVFCVQDVLL